MQKSSFYHDRLGTNTEKTQPFEQAWSKKCSRLFVWNYVGGFECFLLPFPNYDALAGDIAFLAEHGVTGACEKTSLRVFFASTSLLVRLSMRHDRLPRQAQDRQTSRKLTKKDCFVPAGIFNEAAYTGPGGDFAEHNDWVVSKMMWCDVMQHKLR